MVSNYPQISDRQDWLKATIKKSRKKRKKEDERIGNKLRNTDNI